MKKQRTGKLALGGILSALAIVFLLLTTGPVATIGLAALAGVCGIPLVIEAGRKAGLLHFAVVAVLAALLVPTPEGKLMYVSFFGWYTVFKGFIESKNLSRPLEWTVKIAAFLIAVTAYGALWVFVLHMVLPDWFALWMLPVAAVVLSVIFVIYDVGLSRLVGVYCGGISQKIRRIFRF